MAGPRPRHLRALPGRGCRALARLLRRAVADEVVGGRGDLAAFLAGGILAEIILLCEIRLVGLRVLLGRRGGARRLGLRGDLRFLLSRRLRSEAHTSELTSLMRISYAVFCL